ncbi:hypothetical protein J1N35_011451 [Gossypium stocksii]|uniref:Uncharacterized protein n=1 Tax=Gossypium stocksii TaxID=47602 RepID=A0A9D4AD79_9ROSI|nr:hypothetical protein J1N35_011451 [Gossypium stocksii]
MDISSILKGPHGKEKATTASSMKTSENKIKKKVPSILEEFAHHPGSYQPSLDPSLSPCPLEATPEAHPSILPSHTLDTTSIRTGSDLPWRAILKSMPLSTFLSGISQQQ